SPDLPPGSPSRTGSARPRPTPRALPRRPARPWPARCRPWSSSRTRAPRCSTTATRSATRPATPATIAPSSSQASCPPTSVPCSARDSAPSAGWRCPATPRTSQSPTGPCRSCSRATSASIAGSKPPASPASARACPRAHTRPLFCEGLGPFRWVALAGAPEDIAVTDRALKELFPDHEHLHRWLDAAGEHVEFEGLPARICWLGYGERHRAGMLFNDLVRDGMVKAPIAIGRDHLDSGSVASPYRETESMLDGSDAIADWPLLNALTATSSGATWVSIHHGGGVGIGRSIHAGQVGVADGTELAARKLERLLTNDPATG